MLVVGSIVSDAATGVGLAAAAIAVCGFLAHIKPALGGASDDELRSATVIGGIAGLVLSLFVVVLSAAIE